MYGFATSKPPIAIAAAMAYWCYRCRHRNSQANGLDTWKRVTAIVQNAARPAEDLDAYLEQLCRLFWVENLRPDEWRRIVNPQSRVTMVRVTRAADGSLGDIQEVAADQAIAFETWNDLVDYHRPDGLDDDTVIRTAERYPHVVAAMVRLRRDTDLQLNLGDRVEDAIEVEAIA